MTDAIAPWVAGQQVELGGRLYTVDRVTPSGRAFVRRAWFNADGTERGVSRSRWHASEKLQHVTPAILVQLDLIIRTESARAHLTKVYQALERRARTMQPFEREDRLLKIEQLVAALSKLLPEIFP